MPNPNNNPLYKGVLDLQKQYIEEVRAQCSGTYGDIVFTPEFRRYNETLKSYVCPPSWDGITCWPETQAGTIANKTCSSIHYIAGFNLIKDNATKICLETGFWFKNIGGKVWTNYTNCVSKSGTATVLITNHQITNAPNISQAYVPVLKKIAEAGYAVSFLSLVVAILTMISIRKLHCSRNILHMHLFGSFICRAFIFLLKEVLFLDGIGLSQDILTNQNGSYFNINPETNNWECKLLTSLWEYCIIANYSWILMEGLYLHNLIFRAFITNSGGNICGYIIMGWGFPLLIIVPWILSRLFFEDTLCWTTNDNYPISLIISLPTCVSIIINLVFFVRISMVLFNKLKSPLNEDNKRHMKWAKSTLILVPLFGVNYALFLGLKYSTNEYVQLLWITCDQLFGSFQGFFVAILYCFLNGEVKAEIKIFVHNILMYLASNKPFKNCFPCRNKFLRSTNGRTSFCTTMSCSSLNANSILHRKNSLGKCRCDLFPKLKCSNHAIDLKGKEHNGVKNISDIHVEKQLIKSYHENGNKPSNHCNGNVMEETKLFEDLPLEETVSMIQRSYQMN